MIPFSNPGIVNGLNLNEPEGVTHAEESEGNIPLHPYIIGSKNRGWDQRPSAA
jgi:hypothetical protein